jgi:hypothetical protein
LESNQRTDIQTMPEVAGKRRRVMRIWMKRLASACIIAAAAAVFLAMLVNRISWTALAQSGSVAGSYEMEMHPTSGTISPVHFNAVLTPQGSIIGTVVPVSCLANYQTGQSNVVGSWSIGMGGVQFSLSGDLYDKNGDSLGTLQIDGSGALPVSGNTISGTGTVYFTGFAANLCGYQTDVGFTGTQISSHRPPPDCNCDIGSIASPTDPDRG